MRVAILSDTHWGVRGDNIAFLDMTKRFLDGVFFPTLIDRKIDHIVHLGDLVDRRKQVSYLTASRLRQDFLDKICTHGMSGTFIVGNHDCYYKNTNRVNALHELVEGNYKSIHCFSEPTEYEIRGHNTLLLPWICDENREASTKLIHSSSANICLGHLEIQGFEMFRGSVATHGVDRNIFDRFGTTLSGHFHHRSTDGTICYVGSHGEFTWSDYDDARGFHILDLHTQQLEFIPNPHTMFRKVWYDDQGKTLQQLTDFDESLVSGMFLKVIVKNKTNPYWFDVVCERLDKAGPIAMQIVEDHLNLTLEDDEEIVGETEGTLDVFRRHISQISSPNLNKDKLESLIVELYNQALVVE